jgi:hypothetical protein
MGRLAHRLPLHPVRPRAQRHSESIWKSKGAETATSGSTPTAARCDLRGQSFPSVLRDLNLTPSQVWGMARVEWEWSAALETALTATRRDDLKPCTNAPYVAGCVSKECREHQRQRMAKKGKTQRG